MLPVLLVASIWLESGGLFALYAVMIVILMLCCVLLLCAMFALHISGGISEKMRIEMKEERANNPGKHFIASFSQVFQLALLFATDHFVIGAFMLVVMGSIFMIKSFFEPTGQ